MRTRAISKGSAQLPATTGEEIRRPQSFKRGGSRLTQYHSFLRCGVFLIPLPETEDHKTTTTTTTKEIPGRPPHTQNIAMVVHRLVCILLSVSMMQGSSMLALKVRSSNGYRYSHSTIAEVCHGGKLYGKMIQKKKKVKEQIMSHKNATPGRSSVAGLASCNKRLAM